MNQTRFLHIVPSPKERCARYAPSYDLRMDLAGSGTHVPGPPTPKVDLAGSGTHVPGPPTPKVDLAGIEPFVFRRNQMSQDDSPEDRCRPRVITNQKRVMDLAGSGTHVPGPPTPKVDLAGIEPFVFRRNQMSQDEVLWTAACRG